MNRITPILEDRISHKVRRGLEGQGAQMAQWEIEELITFECEEFSTWLYDQYIDDTE